MSDAYQYARDIVDGKFVDSRKRAHLAQEFLRITAEQSSQHAAPVAPATVAVPEVCPKCGQPEVEMASAYTFYRCGSSDYDQRPDSFQQAKKCAALAASQREGGA